MFVCLPAVIWASNVIALHKSTITYLLTYLLIYFMPDTKNTYLHTLIVEQSQHNLYALREESSDEQVSNLFIKEINNLLSRSPLSVFYPLTPKNFANLSMMSPCHCHLIFLSPVHHHHHFQYASLHLLHFRLKTYPSHHFWRI